jgi:hypothetical protein
MTHDPYGATRFAADTDYHQLTVLHDGRAYSHLRSESASNPSDWFEIVTSAGRLMFTPGRGEGFTFAHTTGLFDFFRATGMDADDNPNRINPEYWADKVIGGRDRCRTEDGSGWTPEFLWACNAISTAIRQYDEVNAAVAS